MLPPIAKVPANLLESVSSLVDAASILREVLTAVLQDQISRDPDADLPAIVSRNREELKLADAVIVAWRAHLGFDEPDDHGRNGGR